MIRFLSVSALALYLSAGLAHAATLPIESVSLSSAGLAHFTHSGELAADADLNLTIPLDQADDVLKSLVILDPKGTIRSVSLAGKNPLAEQFKHLPFSQDDLVDTASFLRSLKGHALSIETVDGTTKGRLVSFDTDQVIDEGAFAASHRITLLTDEGVRSFKLDDARLITLDDPKLQAAYLDALTRLSANSERNSRAVTVDLEAKEKRTVRYSYVVEAPLWKTTYRMVIPTAAANTGTLQGWGILENMSGQDWDAVTLSLNSGAPVTYHQALYESYYKDRPSLPVEVFGTLMPRKDDGAVSVMNNAVQQKGAGLMRAPSGASGDMMESAIATADFAAPRTLSMHDNMVGMNAPVQTRDENTLISFTLPEKISLASGHSMMVPFINASTSMAAVYVYQPETHANHPLAAVRLKNEADHGLPTGIITLYNDNSYIGDAEMPAIGVGEDRLISYALDTQTRIDKTDHFTRDEVNLSAVDGILKLTVRERQTSDYVLKNTGKEARTVILEHPVLEGWTIESEPATDIEKTKTHWRVPVTVAADEQKTIAVHVTRQGDEVIAVEQLSYETLTAFAAKNPDEKTKALFTELAAMKRAIDDLENSINTAQNKIRTLEGEQARIRENYRTVPQNSDMAKRYLKTMDEQDGHIAALSKELDKLITERDAKNKAFTDRLFKDGF